jgi:hypothetical protein
MQEHLDHRAERDRDRPILPARRASVQEPREGPRAFSRLNAPGQAPSTKSDFIVTLDTMEFRVLGVVEALEHGLPVSLGGPKQKSLLAMLLLDANHTVSTDRLVDGLWGDEPPQRAAATIHVYVSKLRKAIEPDRTPRAEPTRLLTQPPGYLLAVDPADVDLFRFEEMVGVARALWADGCAVGASVLFREALGLTRRSGR